MHLDSFGTLEDLAAAKGELALALPESGALISPTGAPEAATGWGCELGRRITFAREARKAPGMRFTPILMLTTESEQSKRTEAKNAGATGWLVKPVGPDQLLGVIKQVLPGA